MCDQLLKRGQVLELLTRAGVPLGRARVLLRDGAIPCHPHGLHGRKLWLRSVVTGWVERVLAGRGELNDKTQ